MLIFNKKSIKNKGIMLLIMIVVFLLLITKSTIAKASNSENELITLTVNGEYDYDMALEVLDLVNEERQKEGLEKLKFDADLFQSAMFRASETALYWDHERPNGTMCYTAFPEGYYSAGENIALGQTTAEKVMDEWMNSTGHRENILSNGFNTIGIGCCKVGDIYFWVQIFEYRTSINSDISNCSGKIKSTDRVTIKKDYLNLYLVPLGSGETFEIGKPVEVTVLHFIDFLMPYYPYELDFKDVEYTVDDESIAKIEGNKFTMLRGGTTTLRANIQGVKLSIQAICNEPIELKGDVNKDGKVNARDAKLILQYYTKKATFTEEQKQLADVNEDGRINARDAKLILQYYTGKIKNFK